MQPGGEVRQRVAIEARQKWNSVFVFQENNECLVSPISGLETCLTSNHCFLAVSFAEEKSFAEGMRESFSLCRERVLVFSALTTLSSNWSQSVHRQILDSVLHSVRIFMRQPVKS